MHVDVTLPAEPTSVRIARRFVADALEREGLDEAAFTAAQLVSELATNAVLHARSAFDVSVDVHDGVVRIGVCDTNPTMPRTRHHGVESGTGRGLLLVDRMARAWGVEPRSPGKCVWFEVDAQPDPALLDTFGDELAGSAS